MKENIKQFIDSKLNTNIIFNSENNNCELKTSVVEKDGDKNFSTRIIQLRIKLDDWSPEYKTPWGSKYREKLSPEIFKDQGEISKLSLNSYVDHNISISHMIGSTDNNTMSVRQEGNEIIADVMVDESDPLSRKTANLISSGAIKSNSFIFKAKDISTNENKEGDLEVIFTKGELISIDPVYAGFYPQNTSAVLEKNEPVEDNIISNEIIENLEINKEERKEEITMTEIKKEEVVNVEVESVETRDNNSLEINKINEMLELRNKEQTESITNTIKRELSLLNAKSMTPAEPIKLSDVKKRWLGGAPLNQDETSVLVKEFDSLPESRKKEIAIVLTQNENASVEKARELLIGRKLDGTSASNGLVLIQVLNDPNVLTEMQVVFPELTEMAQMIPLANLNEVKKAILIPDTSIVTSIAEAADSVEMMNKTTKVMFKPIRYSNFVSQNNALNEFNPMLAAQSTNMKNSQYRGLRKSFYDGLLKGIAADLDMNNYEGGATKESVVEAVSPQGISWMDLDKVHKDLIDIWGDSVTSQYHILMHTDTLSVLEQEFFSNQHNQLIREIYNPVDRSFRGIKIHATSYYPQKLGPSTHPVTFCLKSSIVAYGLTFVTVDDSITGISQDMHKRYFRTRGEIKMCDPHLNTRVIKVSATTTARSIYDVNAKVKKGIFNKEKVEEAKEVK